jgi:hypothetical protein
MEHTNVNNWIKLTKEHSATSSIKLSARRWHALYGEAVGSVCSNDREHAKTSAERWSPNWHSESRLTAWQISTSPLLSTHGIKNDLWITKARERKERTDRQWFGPLPVNGARNVACIWPTAGPPWWRVSWGHTVCLSINTPTHIIIIIIIITFTTIVVISTTTRLGLVVGIPSSYSGRPWFRFVPDTCYSDWFFVVFFSTSRKIPG